jgi:Pyruvate/2-oxoacid:ferredoxin oxidoreductase delta subunit
MDGTKLYHAWLELLQGYNANLLSRRDFLKRSVQVGCGYSLLGAVSGISVNSCGDDADPLQSLPQSFIQYEETPSAAHIELAERHSSVLLLGPPNDEHLLALVTHLYTRESAELACLFPNKLYATLDELVDVSGKSPEEIQDILYPVIQERHVVLEICRIVTGMLGYGWVDGFREAFLRFYNILRLMAPLALGIKLPEDPQELINSTTYLVSPIIPPMFEANFMSGVISPWHRRYAVLFRRLFNTGYVRQFIRDNGELTLLRTIPIEESLDARLEVVDEDRLTHLLDSVEDLVLLSCQCAMLNYMNDEPCKMRNKAPDKRPCIIGGPVAKTLIEMGWAERATREEVLRIRRATADEGAMHITFNVANEDCFYVCACCSCCCQLLQVIRDFECPGVIAPPHFLPQLFEENCLYCERCRESCQIDAHDFSGGEHTLDPSRCLGCGQCVRVCPKASHPDGEKALRWTENEGFRNPRSMNVYAIETGVKLLGILPRVVQNRGDGNLLK